MFGIFASKRNKWRKRLTRSFDTYIPGLQGMDAEEIGFLLDQASHIKSSSLMLLEEDDPAKLFWIDPLMIEEKDALERLDFWHKWMLGWSREGVQGNSKVSSMMVFFHSLGAMTIVELRIRGKEMWKELSRGFSSCGRFDPNVDIPIGLKNFKK